MININELLNAKRVTVNRISQSVTNEDVKKFRKQHNMTQLVFASVMGVTKKTVEKWEQGINPIKGSSAILFNLLKDDEELIKKVYDVKYYSEHTETEKYVTIYKNIEAEIPEATNNVDYKVKSREAVQGC